MAEGMVEIAAHLLVEQPAHVGPPEALVGAVGVERCVAVLVVVAVGGDPINGATLREGEEGTGGSKERLEEREAGSGRE